MTRLRDAIDADLASQRAALARSTGTVILPDPNLPQDEGLALFAGGHVCEVRFAP